MMWHPTAEQYGRMQTRADDGEYGEDHRSLARAFGVSEATIRRARSDSRSPRAATPPLATAAEGPSKLDLANDEIKRLKSEQRKTLKTSVMEERVLGAIKDALERTPPCAPRSVPPPKPISQRKTRHEHFQLASDWHAGEVVDPGQVDHLNAFNWEILKQRVDNMRDGMLSFAELTPNLVKLTIGWLGDMVNGIIHEELVASNEFPVAEQAVLVGELMGQLVIDLHASGMYPAIHCAGIAGNHARTKPGHASKNVFDSFDWLAYHLALARTQHLPNVTWELPRSGSHLIEVGGRKVMLFHGDGIKSSMVGFPAGGVSRRANSKQASYAARRQHVDMFACGHFHDPQLMGIGRVLVNGSLVGINEYGEKNFDGGAEPCQLLVRIDADKRRTVGVDYIQTPRYVQP